MMSGFTFEIFSVFFKLSLISFGGVFGVLPELERDLVTKHHWLTHDQFIQSYVLAQIVPGPNMVMCPMIGYRLDGWGGFIAAFAGIYSTPLLLMGMAYAVYHRYRDLRVVRRIEIGLRPLVLGLLGSSALTLWWEQGSTLLHRQAYSLLLALGLTAGGLWLHKRAKVPSLALLFGTGLVTWAVVAMF